VDEVDPRRLVKSSVETLVSILNAVRSRERLLRRELPPWARQRYYGEEIDLRAYPPLAFNSEAVGDEASPMGRYQLSSGRIGIEGQTDETDLDSYLTMLRQVSAFVRHKWDVQGRLSDSVVTRCLIEGLLDSLGDDHTQFLDPADVADLTEETEGAFGGVGLEVAMRDGQLVVVQPIPNTPASRAGVKRGDRILAIDGQPTSGHTLAESVTLMRGEIDTPVELTLERSDRRLVVTMLRAQVPLSYVAHRLLPGKVGYLRITSFMHEELDREVRAAMAALLAQGAESLVVDLRNNPGGLVSMARQVADLFVPEGTIVSTRTRLPGESRLLTAEARGPKFRLPLAVLINGGSASAAEILAGTLQEHELAVLVGERSFGKGSVQRVLSLEPYGCALSLTVATYHLPSGRTPNKTGITPEVVVELDEEARGQLAMRSNYDVEREPIDAQLAAAIEALANR
jgi:carboxyl-terminal processing protease